jgi:excisionase family DNA binding protein
MTIKETAEILGLKVRTIREWIRTGRLQAGKIGGRWYIGYDVIMSREVQERANKGREHSRRIKECAAMGMREKNG